jgi:hypothetical protein
MLRNRRMKKRRSMKSHFSPLGEAVAAFEVTRKYFTALSVDGTTLSKLNVLERDLLNVCNTFQMKLASNFSFRCVCLVLIYSVTYSWILPTSIFIVMFSPLQMTDATVPERKQYTHCLFYVSLFYKLV